VSYVLDFFEWLIGHGADRVIAALEAVEDEILALWDSWDAVA
jgi:hypothetical protein